MNKSMTHQAFVLFAHARVAIREIPHPAVGQCKKQPNLSASNQLEKAVEENLAGIGYEF